MGVKAKHLGGAMLIALSILGLYGFLDDLTFGWAVSTLGFLALGIAIIIKGVNRYTFYGASALGSVLVVHYLMDEVPAIRMFMDDPLRLIMLFIALIPIITTLAEPFLLKRAWIKRYWLILSIVNILIGLFYANLSMLVTPCGTC